ncbi:hypothetical protein IQ257_01030 [Coleofasciculus sp. LEGE 07092]|nr:hypothetical protein [Coleofasciculus sp. LEGE 07081]MBE9147147.1 hypothetical protein [Coleofasciculus sp. LEGE 07092]
MAHLNERIETKVGVETFEYFSDALEAFRSAMSSRFIAGLNENRGVFTTYKASVGFAGA